ncbi:MULTISPECIES: group-specific protein [Paenibacillus]|uniref:Group-specific protein n=1 Tax=Paenibacillus odorifer TaxID=189426 RepID=A0A1R0X0J8_9BACL|nr:MULTISPECIES: group-specific protein [Paenibacillus]OMD00993.1 group-specific protein [Paenibacillus odorifer]OMD25512.1 group-specific protein [Paenibacillus odorifer]OMD73452.1 group-specific protein [Paenibacillus odorifer]OME56419.1 group-specific protein [Paenibacillus odorifer]OME58366.1 group-specific protein [Paenibacillus odorifer]
MLSVNVNKTEVMKMCREQIELLVKEVDSEYVFWDTSELKRRTCLSWNTIQSLFFFDPRFPKRKIGGKWFFPARETRRFLEEWLEEQPR